MGDVKEYVSTAPGLRNHGRILGAHRPTNAMEEQSAEESTHRGHVTVAATVTVILWLGCEQRKEKKRLDQPKLRIKS